ncbi:MAG: IGHMBP2 family helicase [Bacillota bacterium]
MQLIITDIDGEIGPGDIVGAFINEGGVKSDDIGNIEIQKSKAEVEIEDEVAYKVIDRMDNNMVGGVKVRVYPKNKEEYRDNEVLAYINKYEKLVELERIEEMERHEIEIKRLSPEEREEKGRAILHLKGRDEGTAFGNKPIVKFIRQRPGEELPETEISVGDLVMLSKRRPLEEDNPTGTVAEKTRYSISVVFDNNPPGFVYDKNLRMDLYVNDITFQRMLEALEKVKDRNKLQKKLLGKENLEWSQKELPEIEWINQKLNSSQKNAVKNALKAKDFYLIQGPPGTGKTMTAIEIINQAVKQKIDILATADSNIAVDNLVERLAKSGAEVLRVGHPLRVTPLLRQHTLDYKVLEHPDYKEAQKLRNEVKELLDKQEELTHPSGRWRRGMSDELIRKKARSSSSYRGVPPQKLKEMAEWLDIQQQVDEYFTRIDKLEENAAEELIQNADVVCSTNSTSGSEIMAQHNFDLIVIDEATQATEPGALISVTKGKKAVLIGDHKQLPPTVLNQEAAEKGLSESLFERMYRTHGKEFWSLLQIQYRMHNKIMNFSNEKFYRGELKSAPEVRDHTLADLNVFPDNCECFTDKALDPQEPIVFIDTSNMEAKERSLAGSNSYDNPVEAEIVLDIVDEALRLNLDPTQIAVITPYKDQVDLLNNLNNLENLEINTVDGFQGREKEVVINSFVRSNPSQNIGFLRDLRRLNVTLTRAKRKLIIVGDAETIRNHQLYNDLLKYVKKEGLYYQL